ncbi:unnamed protein product [Caenorhabditis auriculariae]|uniref:POU domain protein n=1 Tax=Caenorhabditis auriculariae TaxID=2777116 RepID=A0A8S1GPR0_9PELO|nr:unnamed protein product [Caenorhabditis auriculariae]
MDGFDLLPHPPDADGLMTSRTSPSLIGSSKRKSRPVKRLFLENEETEAGDGDGCGLVMGSQPSDTLLESTAHSLLIFNDDDVAQREEDDVATSEVLSTESDEASLMEQPAGSFTNSDLLRKFAETIAANQAKERAQSQNSDSCSQQEHPSTPTPSSNGMDHSEPSPSITPMTPLFPSTDLFQSPERLLQAMLNPNLNLGINNSLQSLLTPQNGLLSSPLLNAHANATFFHTLMAAATKKPEHRPTSNPNLKTTTKRRLFADEERARVEAANDERIDMSDLEAFAQTFKKQRIKFGFTQGDVGVALGKRYGTDFSQTTISRFEALNLSFKNMCKLRPLLKEWLADIESAIENGATLNDLIEKRAPSTAASPRSDAFITSSELSSNSSTPLPPIITISRSDPNVKRRRKRTNLDMTQRASLDTFFAINPRPDHDKMTEIANSLELERDVVRVWFCNRRQKMRRVDEPTDSEATTPVVNPIFNSFNPLNALEKLKAASQFLGTPDEGDELSVSPEVEMGDSPS